MAFISEKNMSKIIKSRISEETPTPSKTNLFRAWKRAATPVLVAFIIPFLIYMEVFGDECRELINLLARLLFHIEAPGKLMRIAAVLISYAAYFLLYVIIHELIHLIFSIDKQKASIYVVISFPKTVSAFYDAWIPKKKELICLIAPTVVISVLFVPLFWVFPPVYVGLLLMLHLLSCSSDIYTFFYLLKALPPNSMVYGHYYKTESMSGDV